MTYLLDTMVVSYFLQVSREHDLSAAASRCAMALAEDVYRELERDKTRGGRAFTRWFAASNIEVRSIAVGSPAYTTLEQLVRPDGASKDRGERASIALAASDVSLTFVTHDKNGMWIALRELWAPGERILGVPVFLRRLFEAHALGDPALVDEIVPLTNAPRPTWWASWRAEL